MAAFSSLLLAYLLGGLTFLPLLAAAVFLHAYLTFPPAAANGAPSKPHDDFDDLQDDSLKQKLQHRIHEPEAAAGYFAVCREYVPGGVNGKPPERTTPAGETIATESPSVYQSIYRSVFERGKAQAPSLEAGKSVKRARNVFYVVLRHGHLVLFDNADQLEVRHVIALSNYDVDIYAGGDFIPEGELFIKRNCLRLSQKTIDADRGFSPKPFYLFGENCSAKEDMYFSILHNQERHRGSARNIPVTQSFETDDMIGLIRHLHLSEHVQHHRWFNAMIGRVFLALYKTPQLERLIRAKMDKKMSRVSKPAFITSLQLGELDMGHSAPSFFNMKLKECTVDGDVTVEMDVRYNGNMRLVVAAVARIELGSRLKPREVDLVLATTLKMLDGHLLLRIKPPPSNRLWFSFESMPKMDLSIEPILSSRQITYSIITRAIESRLKEVLAETLVSPFWDDIPFSTTEDEAFRGGIWKHEKPSDPGPKEDLQPVLPSKARTSPPLSGIDLLGSEVDRDPVSADGISPSSGRAMSMPPDLPREPTPSDDAELTRDASVDADSSTNAHFSIDPSQSSPPRKQAEKPRALRASSFTSAASTVVSSNSARVSSPQNQLRRRHHDATSAMKLLATHSPEESPVGSPSAMDLAGQDPLASKTRSNSLDHVASPVHGHRRSSSGPVGSSISSTPFTLDESRQTISEEDGTNSAGSRKSALTAALTAQSLTELPTELGEERKMSGADKRVAINQTITSATAAARSWGLGMLQRQMEGRTTQDKSPLAAKTLRVPAEPMGRGQPLPPPGMPLPKPKSDTWSSMAINSLRRKPIGSSVAGHARKESLTSNPDTNELNSPTSQPVSRVESRKESLQSLPDSAASSTSASGSTSRAELVATEVAAKLAQAEEKVPGPVDNVRCEDVDEEMALPSPSPPAPTLARDSSNGSLGPQRTADGPTG